MEEILKTHLLDFNLPPQTYGPELNHFLRLGLWLLLLNPLLSRRLKNIGQIKKGSVTLKEFLADLFSKSDNRVGRNKIHAKVKAASERGEISDLTRGKGIGYTNIDSSQDAWIREGTLDNWISCAAFGWNSKCLSCKNMANRKGVFAKCS